MRQIRFRGKRVDTKEWVYGSLLQSEIAGNGVCFCSISERFADGNDIARYDVIPETVGQFTGLILDEGLTPVFEGDHDEDYQVVMWCEKSFSWQWATYDFPTKEKICCHCYNCEGDYNFNEQIDNVRITGTIHD